MSEQRFSTEEADKSSLFSSLGRESPRPRMKYGGMFSNVEGAFENKTLNFESFSQCAQRWRATPTRKSSLDKGDTVSGQMVAFPSRQASRSYSSEKVHFNLLHISIHFWNYWGKCTWSDVLISAFGDHDNLIMNTDLDFICLFLDSFFSCLFF